MVYKKLLPVVLLAGLITGGMMNSHNTLYAGSVASVGIPAMDAEAPVPEPVKLQGIRYQPTFAGMDIILQFNPYKDQPLVAMPQDFVVRKDPKELAISFSGQLLPGAKLESKSFETPNLKQVYVESRLGKIQVFVKHELPDTARVSLDPQRRRLVISMRNYAGRLLSHQSLAPGVTHRKIRQQTARGPWLINILEVDPKQPSIEVRPVLANGRMGAKSTVKSMVVGHRALAGINASFFKPDAGIPIGALILGDELVAGPLYKRVVLGIDQNNHPHMQRLELKGYVSFAGSDGSPVKVPIHNVNQPRVSSRHNVLYTDRWGMVAPAVPKGGVQILLVDNKVQQVSVDQPLAIPPKGLVISGEFSDEMAKLAGLVQNAPAEVVFYTIPDWSEMKHAISGGPYLVKRSNIFIDTKEQHFNRGLGGYEPRSAVGIKPDGRLLFVTIDGRQKNVSVGASLTELAQLMKELGATEAMNLDGGSSTQMVVGDRLVNSPSVPNGVGVSTSLIVRTLSD